MRQESSRILLVRSRFTQPVSASHCHHQGVVVTSEPTQVVSVLWMSLEMSNVVTDPTGRFCHNIQITLI
jgi:hypothetical protein